MRSSCAAPRGALGSSNVARLGESSSAPKVGWNRRVEEVAKSCPEVARLILMRTTG